MLKRRCRSFVGVDGLQIIRVSLSPSLPLTKIWYSSFCFALHHRLDHLQLLRARWVCNSVCWALFFLVSSLFALSVHHGLRNGGDFARAFLRRKRTGFETILPGRVAVLVAWLMNVPCLHFSLTLNCLATTLCRSFYTFFILIYKDGKAHQEGRNHRKVRYPLR